MRQVELAGGFGFQHLNFTEATVPEPGYGEVLVRIEAASLNSRDVRMVQGAYNPRQPLPLVPLSDGAGTIASVGPGTAGWSVGDRVAGCFMPLWTSGRMTHEASRATLGGPLPGMLREYAVLPAAGVVRAPAHLDAVETAALPCAAVTAWNALFGSGCIQPGEWVATLGTGGVSLFALQLAHQAGARVLVSSSSGSKLDRARSLGSDAVINYSEDENWGSTVRKMCDGGVDHVVELGGSGTLEQSLKAVAPGGTISLIGALAGITGEVNLTPVLNKAVRIQGVWVGSREHFQSLNRAMEAASMHPCIDRVFLFDEAVRAFEYFASGSHFGKVVIRLQES
ncbi:MAG: NAD(P)-dependent alcohol dehydrogenase [Armatimonadetes bacterium]|nr:NAD(P)-dependent alcohol dehydrogenase [Armatimonadota bacterium]MDE2207297.1 NAD(P)-dependent alcohol dehydrogenase [Armatimonadota bacterium]